MKLNTKYQRDKVVQRLARPKITISENTCREVPVPVQNQSNEELQIQNRTTKIQPSSICMTTLPDNRETSNNYTTAIDRLHSPAKELTRAQVVK